MIGDLKMRTLAIYAFGFMAACFIVCCSAGPTEIDADSVIGGHADGDCCESTNYHGFCGHAQGQTCPSTIEIWKCSKTTGRGVCSDLKGDGYPCNADPVRCLMQDVYNEQCTQD